MPGLLVGLVLTSLSPIASAQANPFQGIYAGKARVALGSRGFHQDYYPSLMIVLPDEHSILVTTQLPGAVTSWVISGNFKGNLFEGSSPARLNAGKVYNWGSKIKSGAYASVSEVVRDGVRALLERDAAVERRLREEVVPGHQEYLRDRSKGVPADAILGRIKARRASRKKQ